MKRVLIEDTRQQSGKHDTKHGWWATHDVALIRSKLAWGDYALPPVVCVDTKANIAELATDIFQQHVRFREELKGARDAGVQLVVLVENEDGVKDLDDLSRWNESPRDFAQRTVAQKRIHGSRLAKACATMEARYGVRFEFCSPDEAAKRVVSILSEGGAR